MGGGGIAWVAALQVKVEWAAVLLVLVGTIPKRPELYKAFFSLLGLWEAPNSQQPPPPLLKVVSILVQI